MANCSAGCAVPATRWGTARFAHADQRRRVMREVARRCSDAMDSMTTAAKQANSSSDPFDLAEIRAGRLLGVGARLSLLWVQNPIDWRPKPSALHTGADDACVHVHDMTVNQATPLTKRANRQLWTGQQARVVGLPRPDARMIGWTHPEDGFTYRLHWPERKILPVC